MKKLITVFLLLCAVSLFAQAPEKFSYQAVVRNTTNQLVTNAPVGVRVSILQGSADGEAVYVETHTAATNANGLLTIEIGGGKAEQGEFAGIDWANGPYFLKTETDPNGGSNYTVTSTQQLLSVPYALYAKEAANGFSGDYNDLKNKPAIPQNVGELTNDAGYITKGDLPMQSKGGADDAGVVQTTTCGELDLCAMANQLARLQAQLARQQAQMEETQNALLSTVDDSEPCPGTPTVKDIDGNVYNTVKIGEQCWMRENLRTTRYADGSPIPAGGSNTSTTEPYYYDFPSLGIPLEKRGYLYNCPAAMHGAQYSETNPSNVQGICPDGWHLPSNAEWTQLTDYVGNNPDYVCGYESDYADDRNIIKALSDTSGWGDQYYGDSECGSCAASFNPSTNNATGFSALPTGLWYDGFDGRDAWFWSTSSSLNVMEEIVGGSSFTMQFNCVAFVMANEYVGEYGAGFSVRCLRGSATIGETSVTVPSVTTSEVSDVSGVTAVCGGEVTAEGGAEVTERGVCWGTEPNPTVEDSHTSDGTGTGEFVSTLTDLVPNTNYYVRAYATNSVGTVYGEVMSFTTTAACVAITLPYSENFDSYTTSATAATGVEPNCWELVHEDAAMTNANRPQLYYNGSFAHSGSYSLKLYYRGIYAMPELDEGTAISQVKLEMYLRQANAKYQLQVGVWDGQNFVQVATFNNSTTDVEHVTCDFSSYTGNGRRIAFRNTLGSGSTVAYSTNYLDDITLSVNTGTVCEAISLPYSENFENYTTSTTASTGVEPMCWELVHEDASMTDANRPQLYYNSNFAHSGSYSLKLYNRGIYAMPALSEAVELNNVKLEMYLRQANARYQLQVGIWEEDGTFVPVATFNNSTTDVEHVTCDFSSYIGSGRRIAFRNTLGSGGNLNYSTNYLDDIVLSVNGGAVIDEKSCPGTPTVTDHEGNVYATVQIGNQCWMRDNLRTTTSPSTGTYLIPSAGTGYTYTGKQAFWYNNDSATYAPQNYGLLYNWNAAVDTFNTAYGETSVNTSSSNAVSVTFNGHRRGICPVGWHLPSDAEWNTMEATVSGSDWQTSYETTMGYRGNHAGKLAGGDNWTSSTTSGAPGDYDNADRNVSGFSAVPAGYCYGSSFSGAGVNAFFWSSTQYASDPNNAYDRSLHCDDAGVHRNDTNKRSVYSVRCLRD